jgi:hypothetical protein
VSARDRTWRRYAGERMVLNLRTGRTIVGRLTSAGGGTLELLDAELLEEPGRSPLKLDGRTIIDLAVVEFGQVLPT